MGLFFLLTGVLPSCGSNTIPEKDLPEAETENKLPEVDSISFPKKSAFDNILKKYKAISFDTLRIEYGYDETNEKFSGKELTVKEAKSLPIDFEQKYFGKISGVYACYQFAIDSSRLGLLTRIPGEFGSDVIVLLYFDRIKDKFDDDYLCLGFVQGDAGETYSRSSWLFQAKNKHFQSFVHDYWSVQEIDDTLTTESDYYYWISCMTPKFDTLPYNQVQLSKRFKNLLKTEQ